jgi:hypothetical protein
MDFKSIEDICEKYKGSAPEYYTNPLPERKVSNARMSLNIPADEHIFALIDFTVFGSAKDSMAIANSGIYWKNISDASPFYLKLSELQGYTPSESSELFSKAIVFNERLKISLSGASTFVKNENHVVLNLINDLALNHSSPTEELHEVFDQEYLGNLVKCEFCENYNKPEVTYCKKCGIKLKG